jgi:XTP/dITP diphosphohydrolase
MKKHVLVFATQNQHKVEEVKAMVPDWIEIKSLKDIDFHEELPENGTTFEENALEKAYYVYEKLGLDCFSEDSGLVVDALRGAPGVYTARYAGEKASNEENIDLLLKNMQGKTNRKAHFKTVIALVFDGKKWFFEGEVHGEIMNAVTGDGGFGYDPVFRPDGYQQTFAQMQQSEKSAISHRGIAFQKMLAFFKDHEQTISLRGQGEWA